MCPSPFDHVEKKLNFCTESPHTVARPVCIASHPFAPCVIAMCASDCCCDVCR